MNRNTYSILLYYLYTPIEDPPSFRETHHQYCIGKDLLGRIIIAPEGINGTLSGPQKACENYMNHLKADPRFAAIKFKVTPYHTHAFQKLHVRIKKEIVHAGLPHIKPYQKTGLHLTPASFEKIKDEEDVILLDVRSKYEHKLGKFKDAITLDINHFREFPAHIASLKKYKNKKIVTICTGNVKCEKASAYLLTQGFQKVYQLEGGIIQYGIDTDGSAFEGSCYVFDNRITTPINKKEATVISHCHACSTSCKRMINCANPDCNLHIPLCIPCGEELSGACSPRCQQSPKKRHYDGTGYYVKKMNGYNPEKGSNRAHIITSQLQR